jgi:hypothetical protein
MEFIELSNVKHLIVKQHQLSIVVKYLAAELLNTELFFAWLSRDFSLTEFKIQLEYPFHHEDNKYKHN